MFLIKSVFDRPVLSKWLFHVKIDRKIYRRHYVLGYPSLYLSILSGTLCSQLVKHGGLEKTHTTKKILNMLVVGPKNWKKWRKKLEMIWSDFEIYLFWQWFMLPTGPKMKNVTKWVYFQLKVGDFYIMSYVIAGLTFKFRSIVVESSVISKKK